jgi:hypothetical protein
MPPYPFIFNIYILQFIRKKIGKYTKVNKKNPHHKKRKEIKIIWL